MGAKETSERIVREVQAQRRLPSVSAAVFRKGEVVWSLGVGDPEPTLDTQYRMGSITKTFTAVLVMRLRDNGLVALDAPLGAYLAVPAHGEVTVRRLLSHLSGLQREPVGDIWETFDAPDRERLLADLAETEAVVPAGRRWHYSNLAYGLLGEVVATLHGEPYEQVLRRELLTPLGLARTTVEAEEPYARAWFVDPYADRLHPEPDMPTRAVAAAMQLWSTAADLSRWGAYLASEDPVLDEMCHPQAMADLEAWTLAWGLGLQLFRRGDRIFAGHGGAMPGYLAALVVDRKTATGAVVLTNNSSLGAPNDVAFRLLEAWLDEEPPPVEPWRPGPDVPADVEGILGRWWSEGTEHVFSWRDGRLEARIVDAPPARPPSVFERDGDGWRVASGREQGERLRVVRDASGRVERLYLATYPFTRLPSTFGPPTSPA